MRVKQENTGRPSKSLFAMVWLFVRPGTNTGGEGLGKKRRVGVGRIQKVEPTGCEC